MSKHFGDMVQFESMQDFEKLLAQPRISGRDDSSNSGSSGFTGTKDYAESEQFRQYGDEKSAKSLHKYKAQVDDMLERPIRPRNRPYDDVVGFQPIVPNALMGLPKSMMNQKRVEQKGKVMRIFADMGFNAGTDKEDIAYRGALIMTAIQQLEVMGVRVELWVGVTAGHRTCKDGVGFLLKTKDAKQPLNLHKQAYYVVNPSFLRRTYFRWAEVETRIPDITGGYGNSDNDAERRALIRKHCGDDMIIIDENYMERRTDNEEKVRKHFTKLMKLINKQQKQADERKKKGTTKK